MTDNKRLLKSGKGWRVGWDKNATKYKGLIGTDNWAIELTEAEMHDFCRLLTQLTQTMLEMSGHLMAEERIACEAESDLMWLKVEGYPYAYSLSLIVNQERRCEGHWSPESVQELVKALQNVIMF